MMNMKTMKTRKNKKSKKAAILMVSAALAIESIGAVSVFADPPAMSSEPSGDMPGGQDFGGEMPQAPDGQDFGGEIQQAPDGQAQNNGMQQAPDGQMHKNPGPGMSGNRGKNFVKIKSIKNNKATVERRNMFDSNNPPKNEASPEAPKDGMTPPEKPQGSDTADPETTQGTDKPEMPEGSSTQSGQENEAPAADPGKGQEAELPETVEYDFSTAEIVKESNGKTESASLSDITADTMVELELNEDGTVKKVIIKEKPSEPNTNLAESST